MKRLLISFCAVVSFMMTACIYTQDPVPENERTADFAKGADISWLTQMEKEGVKFYNPLDKEVECTSLLKNNGFDAIRLRIWVNPTGKWCDKADLITKAKRAQKLGMDIMVDFHMSDTWADPGSQTTPAAWTGHSESEMMLAIQAHVKDILQALKDNSMDIRWVQIGNEVNNGMLWPTGEVGGESVGSFVNYLNAGYDAAKSVYPDTDVILHLSNGHDADLFNWFFGLMTTNDAQYDVIGMSIYPTVGGWRTDIDKCLDNIRNLSSMYGKSVIICETGVPVNDPQMSKDAMEYLLKETYKVNECLGVFYWEPQTDGVWKPSEYEGLGWSAYDKGAFRNGRPTIALDPFKTMHSEIKTE